ncbi:hypothetical protein DEO72_LG6g1999 [Vigna unguiculata]|uniref:Uncharacterized protein n=1 Tax=Vigna unguiculata TaxID=3917 RepID=A0A4D6M7D8_VIGUN|nr:hypothetical protein DEO72_LG6g1999 [Vigna unguiculata]
MIPNGQRGGIEVVGVCELDVVVSGECSDGSSGTKMKEVLGCGGGGRSRSGWTVVADEDEGGGGVWWG